MGAFTEVVPDPTKPDSYMWELTNELEDPAADPQPWKHPWAEWISQSMSVNIAPHAQLVWSEIGRWTVSCRFGLKSAPWCILPALMWLGPYLERIEESPALLGYMQLGNLQRPVLVWLQPDGSLTAEDLNPEGWRDWV